MTKKTFTIIELIIVLVIVGALTALSVTYYLDSQQLSKMHTFEANIENIVRTLDIYRSNKVMSGVHSIVYPTSISDTEFKALFTQEPINPYTGKSMLSSASADSGIQYQSDGTSYSICIAQQDVDDINNNGRIDEPLPITLYPACTGTLPSLPGSKYTVSVVATPSIAGIPVASPNKAYTGQKVILSANPNSCYNFSNWSSSDVTISDNSFVMPAKDVIVTANYTIKPPYTVSAAPNNPSYGTVTFSGTNTIVAVAMSKPNSAKQIINKQTSGTALFFHIRATGDTHVTVSLNEATLEVPVSTEWQKYAVVYDTPADTTQIQFSNLPVENNVYIRDVVLVDK